MVKAAAYGSWRSPISSDLVASAGAGRGFDTPIILEGDSIYWVESRPNEGGRLAIARWSPEEGAVDINPAPFNARTRVHEYGGGSFVVEAATVYFSNFGDQRLYRQGSDSQPVAVTPPSAFRYADLVFDGRRKRIICVLEDHGQAGQEAVNTLAVISLNGQGKVQTLVSGRDFYSAPCLSSDGAYLAWLAWDHPHMPWEAAELWLGEVRGDGSIRNTARIAGGYDESVCLPRFSPDGTLCFACEKTGWWNLYRWKSGQVQPLCPMEAEFGLPLWTFGASTYGFESNDVMTVTYSQDNLSHLARLDLLSLKLQRIETPFTSIDSLQVGNGCAVFVAGSPRKAWAKVRHDFKTGQFQVLRESSKMEIDPGYLSTPRIVDFPTENGMTSHAVVYPPQNPDFTGPDGERPPLIVVSHGGPTFSSSSTLSLEIQYWTSRGFAVADVNYGGSTGYGREYRKRLNGQWGIVDVDDCLNCARYLVKMREVDSSRTIIRGRSAGGYTALAALAFRDFFKAGASHYGISDLEAVVADTHKFESRYVDNLVGPYPARRDIYLKRSPVNSAQNLSCPVIFFQGSEDKVVPPDQSEKMARALRERGVPVAYLLFEGEQHGFRKAKNIKRALDAELYFYSRIFGFEPADSVEPVCIDNLEQR
jgi:dipeptidyl aminopeptidase/acylaminoacyl peptidase